MADPRAFISFDFDNNLAAKNLFAGQCTTDSPTPFSVEDWSSSSALPQAEWEKKLKAKINRCHVVIVLVGRSMGTTPSADHGGRTQLTEWPVLTLTEGENWTSPSLVDT